MSKLSKAIAAFFGGGVPTGLSQLVLYWLGLVPLEPSALKSIVAGIVGGLVAAVTVYFAPANAPDAKVLVDQGRASPAAKAEVKSAAARLGAVALAAVLGATLLSGCAGGFIDPDAPRRSIGNVDRSYQAALVGVEALAESGVIAGRHAATGHELIGKASPLLDAAEHAAMVEPTGDTTGDLIARAVAASGDLIAFAAQFMLEPEPAAAADIPAEELGAIMARRHEQEARTKAALIAAAAGAG